MNKKINLKIKLLELIVFLIPSLLIFWHYNNLIAKSHGLFDIGPLFFILILYNLFSILFLIFMKKIEKGFKASSILWFFLYYFILSIFVVLFYEISFFRMLGFLLLNWGFYILWAIYFFKYEMK